MKRAIVAPPLLSPAALTELKAWLGIALGRDDAELGALLRAALEICEGFTGQLPVLSGCEDVLAAHVWWQSLSARPVQAITGVSALGLDGTRRALGVLGATLGLIVALFPTLLIGVCADPGLSCNEIMKPVMVLCGILALAVSLVAPLLYEAPSGDLK